MPPLTGAIERRDATPARSSHGSCLFPSPRHSWPASAVRFPHGHRRPPPKNPPNARRPASLAVKASSDDSAVHSVAQVPSANRPANRPAKPAPARLATTRAIRLRTTRTAPHARPHARPRGTAPATPRRRRRWNCICDLPGAAERHGLGPARRDSPRAALAHSVILD